MGSTLNHNEVLVTGASGYVGRHLVEDLYHQGYHITILVRNNDLSWTSSEIAKRLSIVVGGLDNWKSLQAATKNCEVLFHLATELSMFENHGKLQSTNIDGLKNLLSVLVSKKTPTRFIFISSIDAQVRNSDYANSKREGEKIVLRSTHKNPLVKANIIRVGNVSGGDRAGFLGGVKSILEKQNWKTEVLLQVLGDKKLYPVDVTNLVRLLVKYVVNPPKKKTVVLVDEIITVKDYSNRLSIHNRSFFPKPILKILLSFWTILGRIFKRGDLLIYLSSEKQ